MSPEELEQLKQKQLKRDKIRRDAYLKELLKMTLRPKKKREILLSENVTLVDDSK